MITLLFLAGPAITFVVASSISAILMNLPFLLAVIKAASFSRFSKSAGVNPGVLLAIIAGETSSESGFVLE